MVNELVALAESGATALIGAAATDAWGSARAGVAKLFRRASADGQNAMDEVLDETAQLIEGASPDERDELRRELAVEWRVRLKDLIRQHPDAVAELRSWTQELQERLPTSQQQWVQSNSSHDHGTVFAVQGGNLHIRRASSDQDAPFGRSSHGTTDR